MIRLPEDHKILPHSVPFCLDDFAENTNSQSVTLAPTQDSCAQCFEVFYSRLLNARGRHYLPVCRFADGEFLFALGPQSPNQRLPKLHQPMVRAWHRVQHTLRGGGYRAQTRGLYLSGTYSRQEWLEARALLPAMVHQLSRSGILAMHLSYGKTPFQEHYFPAWGRWLRQHRIEVHQSNYVPFYFVYAALTQTSRPKLTRGRVLVIHSATGDKRARIEASLRAVGATTVHWLPISTARSWFDRVDITPFIGHTDIALVGAGLGKMQILGQLSALQVPCIDAGFIFEVWADAKRASERPFCQPDSAPPAVFSHGHRFLQVVG